MPQKFIRPYNVIANLNFTLYEVDGIDFRIDASHVAGDTKIMKDDGTEANTANAFVDEGQGYSLVLTAAEMSAGRIVIYIVDQTATKDWLDDYLIIETFGNVSAQTEFDFDLATQPVNVIELNAVPQSLLDLKDFADDGYDPATNKVQGVVLVDTTTTNTDMLTAAAVNTEVDTALADINLDHLLFNVAIDANVTNDSLWAQLTSKAATPDYSTFDNITDSLEALADMSAPSAETIADAVWDELTSGHVIAGSFGKLVSDIDVKTSQLTFTVSNQLDSNMLSIISTTISGGTNVASNLGLFFDNSVAATSKVVDDVGGSASGIADAVWDELRAGHVIAGSFGEFVNSNLVSIEGSATIDTLGITTMFENIISHAQRDVVRVGNTYTYKKQDGTTTTFEYTVSAAGRT